MWHVNAGLFRSCKGQDVGGFSWSRRRLFGLVWWVWLHRTATCPWLTWLTMWQIVTLCYLHSSTIDSLGVACRPTRSVEVVLRDWRPWLGQWRAASLHRWSQQCLGFRWSSTHPGQATIFGTAELHIFPADDQRKSGLAIRSRWSPATAPIRSWYLGSCLDAANKQ